MKEVICAPSSKIQIIHIEDKKKILDRLPQGDRVMILMEQSKDDHSHY